MPIKQVTLQSAINSYTDEQIGRVIDAVVYNLGVIGEKVVNEAREKGSYTDRTGNLRSSTGYVIVVDGKISQMSSFQAIRGQGENAQRVSFTTKAGKQVDYWAKGASGDGSVGKAEGESYARSLASRYPKGIVLIVVAGMRYASYVSAKGFDVLDSSELLAERLVPRMLQQLGFS